MRIKFLSELTINRIAAGEVVERPASVVKELVENAIDAGSNKIEIILESAGKNLILVKDNGCGMTRQELEIAIQRHTTSKLDETDLMNIRNFGFRGEALPSIASISKISITSKAISQDQAYKIELIGGKVTSIKPALHNVGTSVEVRDLFFATPARLKFMRSDNTELGAIVDYVKKIALVHHEIDFVLSHNGKILLELTKLEHDQIARFNKVLGKDFINNSCPINFKHDDLTITGYTSLPTFNKATANEQFLFVNNRTVKDKLLSVALRIAYQDYLARDRHPIVALFLTIDPQLVDVNVHPAKNEVRFQDNELIRKSLVYSIRQALQKDGDRTSSTISDKAQTFFIPMISPEIKAKDYSVRDSNINNKRQHSFNLNKTYDSSVPSTLITPEYREHSDSINITNILTQNIEDYKLGIAKTQIFDNYIIAQTIDGLAIIDQHAAAERLLYEQIKEQYLHNKALTKQRLLIPEIIEFEKKELVDNLNIYIEKLSLLGFTIEIFANNSLIIQEVPALFGEFNIRQVIIDLTEYLLHTGEAINIYETLEHILETYACHHSIRSGRKLSIDEMNKLLRQMENTAHSSQCNHGRPTYIKLKLQDIEKLFGRK